MRKQADQLLFYVLVISGKKCRLFKHEDATYVKIPHGPESVAEVVNDIAEPVSNFSDPKARKQATLIKFLRFIDQWLGKVISTSTVPVFLLAPEKVAGHFKKLTAHKTNIAGYVHGNFDDLTIPQLKQIIQPLADRLALISSSSKNIAS